MSTITRPGQRVDVLHPLVASTVGAVTFAATMVAGDVLGLNSDADDAPATTLQDLERTQGSSSSGSRSPSGWAHVLARVRRTGWPRRRSGSPWPRP